MPRNRWFPLVLTTLVLVAGELSAQTPKRKPKFDPVKWTLAVEPAQAAAGGRAVARLTATIEQGWRLYAPTTPKGGPIPTELKITEHPAVAAWKPYQPQPKTKFDSNFQFETQTYSDEVVFLFDVELSGDAQPGTVEIESTTRYNACNDRLCLPPAIRSATAAFQVVAETTAQAPVIPADYQEAKPTEVVATPPASPRKVRTTEPGSEGFLEFAAVAFGFGVLAIFTPCVFPMIPITMSYFVSTNTGSRRQSLIQAVTFCVGVIVLFTGIGAAVSAVLGPFGLSQLGANVWINLLIALVFLAFGASLLGVFEITVPSGALTSLNQMSNRGGLLGTLVMGLVFALASFACTGPFIGALLAGSIQGDLTWPILGMMIFSTGLALPFFFLALFPAYLAKLPKSGGWLARTKITVSFLVFAAAVKYLSNVDQVYQWFLLTRERVLAIWIVLLAMASFYLLGMLRIGDDETGSVGPGRLGVGALFLILAVSMIPGMFGGRLGELDAYIPSPEYSGFQGSALGGKPQAERWIKNDYAGALEIARQNAKNVLVSFTGYTCTNCHWMKANMFTRPELAGELDNLVLVELYTDGADEASQANQKLQLERFETVAIPYYAIIEPNGTVIAEFPGRTRDVEEFRGFLASAGSATVARAD